MDGEQGKRVRFALRLLDDEDPFEIDDGNRPHLFKHLPMDSRVRLVAVGPEDVLDIYLYGDPSFFEAKEAGSADWLMVGMVPGLTICVPLHRRTAVMLGGAGRLVSTRRPRQTGSATCGVIQMSDRDDAAAAYYEDPENRELRGSGQKRPPQPGRLNTHVPIRFSAGIIERVKDLAADDGKTVSSWIRDVVEREVLRRERSKTVGIIPTVQWKERLSEPSSSTLSSGEQSVEDLRRLVSLS